MAAGTTPVSCSAWQCFSAAVAARPRGLTWASRLVRTQAANRAAISFLNLRLQVDVFMVDGERLPASRCQTEVPDDGSRMSPPG
jgi:hypothetical protein